jgi:low affinity Fe/Cu permease
LNRFLFQLSDFLSRPPGFYFVLGAMALCTALVPLGMTDVVTFALSVLAIVITGIVLIQGFRDTAAIHAKLDEIIVSLNAARNDVVGLEHGEPAEIEAEREAIEKEAASPSQSPSDLSLNEPRA